MLDSAKKWLHKSWWGAAIAYPIIFISVYGLIWFFAEPIGIPDSFSKLPDFTQYRIFFHLLIALITTPHVVLVLLLLVRRAEKKDFPETSLKVSNTDRVLFEKFLTEFPPEGTSVRFLHEQDIGSSFESTRLDQIQHFIYYWHDAAHEFQNVEAEQLRVKLYDKLNAFTHKLYENVTESHRSGWLTMGIKDFDERQYLLKAREDLNEIASDAYALYQELVRLGRRFE